MEFINSEELTQIRQTYSNSTVESYLSGARVLASSLEQKLSKIKPILTSPLGRHPMVGSDRVFQDIQYSSSSLTADGMSIFSVNLMN